MVRSERAVGPGSPRAHARVRVCTQYFGEPVSPQGGLQALTILFEFTRMFEKTVEKKKRSVERACRRQRPSR